MTVRGWTAQKPYLPGGINMKPKQIIVLVVSLLCFKNKKPFA